MSAPSTPLQLKTDDSAVSGKGTPKTPGLSGLLSPLGGLQRITEELKSERNKSTQALQENARLKIEVKSLEQRMQQTVKVTPILLSIKSLEFILSLSIHY
jgi:hypothetical protein